MNDQGRTVGVQKCWMRTAALQCDQRRIQLYRGRAVCADIEVRQISGVVEVRIEHPVNGRRLCMNVSSGGIECWIAAIGLLVEVHAVPALCQPLRLNPKDDAVGRGGYCDLADHLAL